MNLRRRIDQNITLDNNSRILNLYRTGTGNFAGNSNTVTIAHNLGRTPSFVIVIPTDCNGFIGEYSVTYDANNIYVKNTGSGTLGFSWIAFA